MAGAIIPDDWDGVTFQCTKIEWPASLLWQAILLGQMTEAAREDYWDAESGNPQDAAVAVADAYSLTIPAIYEAECNEVHPGIPVPAFKVHKTSALGLASAVWTFVPWEIFTYEYNDPDFVLPISQHLITEPDLFGLWHYDFTLKLTTINYIYVRARETPPTASIVFLGSSSGMAHLSFDYVWTGAGKGLFLEVYSDGVSALDIQPQYCQWNAHFVGPVVE